MPDDAPNILLLMTDQHKASACGFTGNRFVPTPFLDGLAKEGTVFDQAFSVSSICTPSRTSIFTGVHPLVHDVTCHQNRAPFNLPQLSEILKRNGYYTAVAGHYEPQRNLHRGWHEQVEFLERGKLQRSFLGQVQNARADVGWGAGGFGDSPGDGNCALLTDRMIRMLDQIENAKSPFFLHAAYDAPHPPYFVPPPFDTMVDPDSLELPPAFDPDLAPEWQNIARDQLGSDAASEADVRKVLAVYYGMIGYADSEMRRLYDEMKHRGMLENTWIVFTSDHGDYATEKGMFAKTESLYECLLHVPMFVVPPVGSEVPKGERSDTLVESVDIFPTILGLAGIDIPSYVQGHDLRGWIESASDGSPAIPLRENVFAQVGNYHGNLGTTFPTGMPAAGRHRSLLMRAASKEFSFVSDPDYGDEAYDLRNDPWELRNIAGGEVERIEIAELRRAVEEWRINCEQIKAQLEIVPGERGFVDGWE